MSAPPLVLVRGPARPDERLHTPAEIVARLRALADGGALDFSRAYLSRAQRPCGHGVACRAAGVTLGYAFPPVRREAEHIADVEALMADLAQFYRLGEQGRLANAAPRRGPTRRAA